MKRFVLGTVIAAVVCFVWGAVYWMSPMATGTFKQAKSDSLLGAELKLTLGETGVYFLPGAAQGTEEYAKAHREGPIALLFFQREGAEPMAGSTFAAGFAHGWVTIALIAVLLGLALPALSSYASRVGFVTLAGVASGVFSHIGGTVWWPIGLDWGLLQLGYHIGFWLLAGVILAVFYKPDDAAG